MKHNKTIKFQDLLTSRNNFLIRNKVMDKMNIYSFLMASLVVVAGCSNPSNGKTSPKRENAHSDSIHSVLPNAQNKSEKSNIDEATKSLRAIYAQVFAWYSKAENDISLLSKSPDFEARYMSSSYNDILRKVRKLDNKLAADGYLGFFESDHWVCGQDFQNIKATVNVGVMKADKYSTTVSVINLGEKHEVGVEMVKEKGKWLIDDMLFSGVSEKSSMQRYLASGGKER